MTRFFSIFDNKEKSPTKVGLLNVTQRRSWKKLRYQNQNTG